MSPSCFLHSDERAADTPQLVVPASIYIYMVQFQCLTFWLNLECLNCAQMHMYTTIILYIYDAMLLLYVTLLCWLALHRDCFYDLCSIVWSFMCVVSKASKDHDDYACILLPVWLCKEWSRGRAEVAGISV